MLPDDVTVLCMSHTQQEVTLWSSWGSQGLQLMCAALPHAAILELTARSLAQPFLHILFWGGAVFRPAGMSLRVLASSSLKLRVQSPGNCVG